MSGLAYKLSLELDKRGYNDKKALGYLDAIQDLQKIEEQPQLNENQQKYLKQLQYNHERLGNTHDALFFGLVDYEKRWNFNDENFAQVLQVFSQWAIEQGEI
nr:MAG TPA: hypothetical protein [Herelleviridae sp.]